MTDPFAPLLGAFFRSVSFAAGERPDYEALHGLFVPGGRLIKNSGDVPEINTVDEFIAPRRKMVDEGRLTAFEEVETAHVTELFGNVGHRFSTYEKQGLMDGAPMAGRGLIATQFIRTPDGWKMTTMAWDDERPGLTVPERYLP